MPDPDSLAAWDVAHLIHPDTPPALHRRRGPLILVRGEGSTVWDAAGRAYLDAMAGLSLVNVGYGRRELVEAAREQMQSLHYFPTYWGYSNPPAIRLARRLAELAPVEDGAVMFTGGGGEAVETAVKLARAYHAARGRPRKQKVIALDRAYHGLGYGAMELTGFDFMRAGAGPGMPGVVRIPAPYCYRCPLGAEYPPCAVCRADVLGEVLEREDPDTMAAVLAEPVLGVGGGITPPPDYFRRVRALCDAHDVLFIADEVITAFGRTGRWFGLEHWGVRADLVAVAKGLTSGYAPLGAAVAGRRVVDALADAGAPWPHGYTWSGHPVSCAVGLANLDVIAAERLGERAAQLGARLRRGLELRMNPHVGDVRGLGLFVCVELVRGPETREPFREPGGAGGPKDAAAGRGGGDPGVGAAAPDFAGRVQAAAREAGVLVATCPGDILQISPPLVIGEADVDRIVAVLDQAIRDVAAAG